MSMNYLKFEEIINNTLVLSPAYKEQLLDSAKVFNTSLLIKITVIVYNKELEFIKWVKDLKNKNNLEQKHIIETDEKQEKIEAEREINTLLNF